MSDNIPFEIQMEIIQKVPNVKSLIQFRSVSKSWKSFIDSSEFIKGYGTHHTQPRCLMLSLSPDPQEELRYICLVEDDHIETFKVQQQELAPFVVSPLLKQCSVFRVVGACHGLLCLFGYRKDRKMVVIWNPSIGKSFGIVVPKCSPEVEIHMVYGFGVCPVTSDPTVVKVLCSGNTPWHVEVFTLSSGVWNVIPSGNLPRPSIKIITSIYVVIDRFIYWGAFEITSTNDGRSIINHMVVSFDLITKEFKVVDLPDFLTNELNGTLVCVSKLRESLVVYGFGEVTETCSLWVMQHDSSFRKLFTIGSPICKILGFRNNGEPIFRSAKELGPFNTLDVYDPSSQQIKNIGFSGLRGSFFMDSYKESLLLLDHTDLHIYSHDS